MRNINLLGALAIVLLGTTLMSAQATRTWVSGVGDDVNPCSRTAPCKTFAGAISKTAPAGEINVLDPGGFGAVTITKSITISSIGFEAGVLVSGTNGIVISAAATDQITLKGLDIEGLGTGIDGVRILAAAAVNILNCQIHHFTSAGVNSLSTTAGGRVLIKDSIITQNQFGVNIQGNGVQNVGTIVDTIIDGNTNSAVQVVGVNNIVSATRSFLTNSPTALSVLSGGTAVSNGPSNVISGAGAFTLTPAFQ